MKKFVYLIIAVAASFQLNAQVLSLNAQSDTLCLGDSTAIYAMGGSSYTWSPNTGLDTTSGDTVIAMPSANITYMVIATVGMAQDTEYVSIVVNATPSVMAMAVSDTVCSGIGTELSASGAQSYTWSPSSGLNTTTGDTVFANPTSSTSYEVLGVDSNGCSAIASQQVTVLSSPTITLNVPQFVCVNTATRISVSGADSYQWFPPTAFDKDTGDVVLISLASSATINVIGTAANGCEASRGTLVRTNSAPAVLVLEMNERDTNAVEICEGDTVELSCVGAGGNGIYTWTGTSLIGNSGLRVSANPTTTETYKVVGDNLGCKDSINFTINVNASPSISLSQSSGGAAICKDEVDSITVTSTANMFRWNIAGSEISTSNKVKGIAPGITSTIVVTAISDESCEGSAQIVILVDTTCGENLSVEQLAQESFIISTQKGKSLNWEYNNPNFSKLQLTVLDINARLIFRSELTSGQSVQSPELKEGVYITSFETESGERWVQKSLIH